MLAFLIATVFLAAACSQQPSGETAPGVTDTAGQPSEETESGTDESETNLTLNLHTIFAGVGIIILLGFISDLIFSKTEIPDVIWLILVGILIGPVFKFITQESIQQTALVFTSFALLFILFEGGLHIRIKDLMKSMYGATAITIANFLLTTIVITVIATFAGWNWINSLLLGTILGGTSSAVVVPIVRKLSMGSDNSLILILESAFSDVLCIVASLSIIEIVAAGDPKFGTVINSLFGSFAIAIFIGAITGFLWILLLEKFKTLSKSYISTIGVLMLIYSLTEFANSSGAIAGLTFGIVLGNSRRILSLAESDATDTLSVSARAFFSQISFFVKTFFFVYIGILVVLTDYVPIILGFIISLAIFFVRPIPVKLAFKSGEKPKDRAVMESMIPKGLAAAVLAQVPAQAGIEGASQIITPVISTIFFTIVITTIMVFLSEKTGYPGTSGLVFKILGKKPKQQKAKEKPSVNVIENSGQDQANTQEESIQNQPVTGESPDQSQQRVQSSPGVKQPAAKPDSRHHKSAKSDSRRSSKSHNSKNS